MWIEFRIGFNYDAFLTESMIDITLIEKFRINFVLNVPYLML